MKKSRFSEEQIIGFIKEAETGMPVAELLLYRVQIQRGREGGAASIYFAGVFAL